MTMQTPPARADLISGIVLLGFGMAVVAESYAMPRLEERNINPWTVPGLVPALIGIVIAALGAALALRSLIAGALKPLPSAMPAETNEARAARNRLVLCLGLCLVYAIVLVGRVPFWIATGLFVFAFIGLFEWRRDDHLRTRLSKLGIAAIVAGAAMFAIPLLFERLFLVRLP